jgi:hypothetical protein
VAEVSWPAILFGLALLIGIVATCELSARRFKN